MKIAGKLLLPLLMAITILGVFPQNSTFANAKITHFSGSSRIVVKQDGHIIAGTQYDNIGSVSEGMLAVCQKQKWGYMDVANGKIAVPFKYDYVSEFNNGVASIQVNRKYGLINKEGKLLAAVKYTYIYADKNPLFRFSFNGQWGFMDTNGREVIHARFDEVGSFRDGIAPVELDGKWGFIDETGKYVVKPIYQAAGSINALNSKKEVDKGINLNYVKEKNLYGFVDNNGKIVTAPSISGYYSTPQMKFSDGLCPVLISGKIGFVDLNGKIVIQPQFDTYSKGNYYYDPYLDKYAFSGGLCAIQKDKKWGYIDHSGKMVIPAIYTQANSFSYGVAWVSTNNGSALIDNKGKIVVSANTYSSNGSFFEGLCSVTLKSKTNHNLMGYINNKGEMVIKPTLSSATNFNNGFASVTDDVYKKNEIMDKTGKVIFSTDIKNKIGEFKDGFASFSINAHYGIINSAGKIIINPEYSYIGEMQNGVFPVDKNGLWGFVDITGKVIFKPIFTNSCSFVGNQNDGVYAYPMIGKGCSVTIQNKGKTTVQYYYNAYPETEGMIAVQQYGQWGFLDSNGILKIPFQYDQVQSFSDGMALVCTTNMYGNMFGYIDKSGKLAIPYKYSLALPFSEGLACVNDYNHVAYIDKTGKEVIKLNWNFSSNYYGIGKKSLSFKNGLAVVLTERKYGFRDSDGNIAIKPQYDDVSKYYEGLCGVMVGSKWGFIDEKGKFVVKPQYDQIHDFTNGIASVYVNGHWGIIDKSGNYIIKPKYSDIGNFSNGIARVGLYTSKGYLYGFINSEGNEIIKPQYTSASEFHGNVACVYDSNYKQNGITQPIYIDKTGKTVIKPEYSDYDNTYGYYSLGYKNSESSLYPILLSGKYIYIDKKGNFVKNAPTPKN